MMRPQQYREIDAGLVSIIIAITKYELGIVDPGYFSQCSISAATTLCAPLLVFVGLMLAECVQ